MILLASDNRFRTIFQTRYTYWKCYPNEGLKCQVSVKGGTESAGLMIRRCSDERINAPTIQISDKSATVSIEDYHGIDEADVYAH
jgi:hypothetical protein